MVEPMNPLPTNPDDPRLKGWYHSMELAPGVFTEGHWDHRESIDRVGIPKSLIGKKALDIGTADGFWAFEMERRGAEQVTAIDLARLGDVDLVPRARAKCSHDVIENKDWPTRFATAHAMLGSRVIYKNMSVYDLSPETLGEFDVVFSGAMLVHLINPLQALINIRSVTKEFAVIETSSYHPDPVEDTFPDRPYMWFGALDWEGDAPGNDVTYWSVTSRALCDMLIYAGFSWVEPLGTFPMKRGGSTDSGSWKYSSVIAHVAPNPELVGYRKVKALPVANPAPVLSTLNPDQRLDAPQAAPSPIASRSLLRRIVSAIKPEN